MKNFENKKSVLERGGLMIEALAMLGLIAVVTPTMYKKSAERTMEVEDINTASAIRTYMNGIESLLAANYTELMEKIPEPQGDVPTIVPLCKQEGCLKLTVGDAEEYAVDELKKYLPYGYDAENNLYNYSQPTYAVARTGNNLSAFMVFPAKTSGDDGIGQERTVRIASLIGSNGGYIRGGNARGVGGTWSLNGSDENTGKKILGNAGDYSIVTSSIDVVRGSEGMGGDMTKYLQRTAENGETWRNTMRTDIYMGEFQNKGEDYDDKTTDGYFSIRNINQLIVGADGYIAANDTSANQATDASDLNGLYKGAKAVADEENSNTNGKAAFSNFGLYIADEPAADDANRVNKRHGLNAYIAGSLEAAGRMLFADDAELSYHGPRVQLGGMQDSNNVVTDHLIAAVTKADEGFETTEEANKENRVEILPIDRGGEDGKDPMIIASDNSNVLKAEMAISTTETDDEGIDQTTTVDGFDGMNLIMAKGGSKDADDNLDREDYDNPPDFPVLTDSNMAVSGILAAGQIDTNKIRAASLAVGSEKIDESDAEKWMNVDMNGVRIHDRDSELKEDGSIKKSRISAEINDNLIAMRFGSVAQEGNAGNSDENEDPMQPTAHESQFIMDDSGIKLVAQGEDNTAAEDHSIELTTSKDGVRERLEANQITIGSPDDSTEGSQYRATYENGGHVDMIGTTLQVMDEESNPVLTIRGNAEVEDDHFDDSYNDPTGTEDEIDYKITAHGNTVFTDSTVGPEEENDAVQYLAMGRDEDDKFNAGVNIVNNTTTERTTNGAANSSQRVLFIDLDEDSAEGYIDGMGNNQNELRTPGAVNATRTMHDGTIYIRKGLIDIAPTRPQKDEADGSGTDPDSSSSTIRASRFVANNIDKDGNRVTYVSPIKESEYEKYNGTDYENRYDTYMVNPAYTSVMKDIKLTSRLGARLSDILPDFITKGVYIATNNYGEDEITLNDDFFELPSNPTPDNQDNDDTNDHLYASPYAGAVPAPQCPPGYGKAIMFSTSGFEMGTVGNLEKIQRGNSVSLDVSTYDMLGVETVTENGKKVLKSKYKDNSGEDARTVDDMVDNQPTFGLIKDLRHGVYTPSGSTQTQDIPAQLLTSEGSATYSGGTWDPKPGDRFYTDDTSYPDDSRGDLENRLTLTGGIDAYATSGGVSTPYGAGSLYARAAKFDERSFADLREQVLYIDHFGYGDAEGADSTIADSGLDQKLKTPTLSAQVIAQRTRQENNADAEVMEYVGDDDDVGAYFLVAGNNKQKPLTFQKSTWLKAVTIGSQNGDYTRAWSLLLGFVYPPEIYDPVKELVKGSQFKDKENELYWNIFPVRPGSLEGYATTYCFIDNKIIEGETLFDDNQVDFDLARKAGMSQYNVEDFPLDERPSDYGQEADEPTRIVRKKYLNDPALKYDELW